MGDIIGINGFFGALPVDYLTLPAWDRSDRAGAPGTDPGSAGAQLADEVEVSTLGSLLARMTEVPGVRLSRIARIRAAIVAGTYETPAKISTVVDRLFERLED
jgi:anti-sigma28 factor (negative regulator of flagellin synthesis)